MIDRRVESRGGPWWRVVLMALVALGFGVAAVARGDVDLATAGLLPLALAAAFTWTSR